MPCFLQKANTRSGGGRRQISPELSAKRNCPGFGSKEFQQKVVVARLNNLTNSASYAVFSSPSCPSGRMLQPKRNAWLLLPDRQRGVGDGFSACVHQFEHRIAFAVAVDVGVELRAQGRPFGAVRRGVQCGRLVCLRGRCGNGTPDDESG